MVAIITLERKDFSAIADSTIDEFLSMPVVDAPNYSLRMTSGTSAGVPLVMMWDNSRAAHGLFAGSKRVIICSGLLSVRLGNALLVRNGLAADDARVLCMDLQDDTEALTQLLDDYAPSAFYGFPSFVARVSSRMTDEAGSRVETLSFTGENISPALRNIFNTKFPNSSLRLVYNTNETGALSKPPCGHLPLDSYHPADGVSFSIYEPDDTGAGDILVSKRITDAVSVEGYRVGDVGRISTTPCACGERVTLQVLGRRGYDYIKIAGALLLQKEFERVAALCEDLFDDYRAEAFEVEGKNGVSGKLILRVFWNGSPVTSADAREIAQRFENELFVSPTKTLGDFIARGAFLPVEVECESRPFPASHKNLKLAHRSH